MTPLTEAMIAAAQQADKVGSKTIRAVLEAAMGEKS